MTVRGRAAFFRRLVLPALLLPVVLHIAAASPLRAAEVSAARSAAGVGVIALKGAIAPGDGDRFADALRSAGYASIRPSENSYGVCSGDEDALLRLDSQGGSFAEALALARIVAGHCIGTLVDAGASCTGPCAYVFMAGSVRHHHWQGFVADRRLHARGRLVFKPPAADGWNFITELLAISTENVHQFEHRMAFPRDLLAEILAAPGKGVSIDRIDQAGRWNIALEGLKSLSAIRDEMLAQGCFNLFSWREGQYAGAPRAGLSGVRQAMTHNSARLETAEGRGRLFHAWMGDALASRCGIALLQGGGGAWELRYQFVERANGATLQASEMEEFLRTAAPLQPWKLLAPQTVIGSLARGHE